MGWLTHGIYGGDGTQSRHIDWLEKAGLSFDEQQISKIYRANTTKIPEDIINKFIDILPKIKKSLPKFKLSLYEDDLIEWQMLAALLNDNNIFDKDIYRNGVTATEILMGPHAGDFNNPYLRRQNLKRFRDKLKKKIARFG